MTIRAVVRRHGVSWPSVNALVRAWSGLIAEHRRSRRCAVLLVDETSMRKRHRYVTVIVNGDTGRTLAMVEHRSSAALAAFLMSQPHKWRRGVKVVVTDGSRAYKASVDACLPVGAHNSVVGADQGFRAPSWDLMCRILCRFLALLAQPPEAPHLPGRRPARRVRGGLRCPTTRPTNGWKPIDRPSRNPRAIHKRGWRGVRESGLSRRQSSPPSASACRWLTGGASHAGLLSPAKDDGLNGCVYGGANERHVLAGCPGPGKLGRVDSGAPSSTDSSSVLRTATAS